MYQVHPLPSFLRSPTSPHDMGRHRFEHPRLHRKPCLAIAALPFELNALCRPVCPRRPLHDVPALG